MKAASKRSVLLTLVFTLIVCLFGTFALTNPNFARANTSVTVEQVNPAMVKGASVRTTGDFGLRYTFYMSETEYQGLMANQDYEKVTFGVLVAPEYYETTFGALTEANLFGASAKYDWADMNGNYTGSNSAESKVRIINAEGFGMVAPNEELAKEIGDDKVVFNGSVINFKSEANTLLNYKGVGYVCGEKADGTLVYKLATANDNLRSMVYVAQKAVEDGIEGADQIAATYLTESVKNTEVDYTVEYYFEDVATGEYALNDTYTATKTAKIGSTATLLDAIEAPKGYAHIENGLDKTSATVYADGSTTLKYYFNKVYTKEFDLKGGKTLDVTSVLEDLHIDGLKSVSIVNADSTTTAYTLDGTTLTNVEGKEKATLIFEGEDKTSIVDAKIYTLAIDSYDDLVKMISVLETNKVVSSTGGYVSGGYFALTSDVVAASGKAQITPAFFIKDNNSISHNGFNGIFDGQGYSIDGINTVGVRSGSGDNAGLAAWGMLSALTNGGVIKNVSIKAGVFASTRTIFGKYCEGTVENVRIHVETGTYDGNQGVLFDYNTKGNAVIKNVFITFGDAVAFNGNANGLFSAYLQKDVTIEGLYVVGSYANSANAMKTWCKEGSATTGSESRYIAAMSRTGAKLGAYFASAQDFADGIETIEGAKQTATDVYKNQIATLFNENIWDLDGTYPEISGGIVDESNVTYSIEWEEEKEEIELCTSNAFGGVTDVNMPAKVLRNGKAYAAANYTLLEVDADGKEANTGVISITSADIFAVKEGTTYVMAQFVTDNGVYNTSIVKVTVTRSNPTYDGVLEIDLKGGKTIDFSSYLTTLGIEEEVTGIKVGEQDLTIDGKNVTGLVGAESATLTITTASYDMEVPAKIYTLKINNATEFYNMGATIEANKVKVGVYTDSKGNEYDRFVSGGYYVLTTDIIAPDGNADYNPAFYVALDDRDSGFNGVFDGQGYTIQDVQVYTQRNGSGDRAGLAARGMFTNITAGGVIKNVTITAGIKAATNTILARHFKQATLENVRFHVEQFNDGANANQTPIIDDIIDGGTIKNVFITFGAKINLKQNYGGLLSARMEAAAKIEGLYVVGSYTVTAGNKMVTWAKGPTHDNRYINAMSRTGAKLGAYFASAQDFADGIETIESVKQTATDTYKNQIASLYSSDIWDLTGTYPELIKPTK